MQPQSPQNSSFKIRFHNGAGSLSGAIAREIPPCSVLHTLEIFPIRDVFLLLAKGMEL